MILNMVYRFCLWSIIGLLTTMLPYGKVQAQGQEGEIEDVEIEIIKEREITLPRAIRNFEKVPPNPVEPPEKNLSFKFKNFTYNGKDPQLRLRPLRLKEDKLSKTYGNLVKAGFGNFLTPYLEAFVNNKRSKEYSYGAHFKHLSSARGPVDGKNSSTGETNVSVFAKAFTPNAIVGGTLQYDKRNVNFYGYPEGLTVEKDTIEQSFGRFQVRGTMTGNKDDARLKYHLRAGLDFLSDTFEARENEFSAAFEASYELGESTDARLESEVALITRKDVLIDNNRTLFKLKPSVGFTYEGFELRAGINAVFENDTLGKAGKLHLYPVAQASYPVASALTVYAGIEGDIDKRTLNNLSMENPFLQPDVPVFHSNKTFSFFGGIQGKLTEKLAYNTGFSASNYKNMYFYINSTENTSKFDIVYETGNTALFNYFAEAIISEGNQLNFTVRGDFYGYNTANLIEAWHKPSYKLALLASSNVFDKILLSGDIYLIGGIEALNVTENEQRKLPAAADINVKAEYLISDQVSTFLAFKNILSSNYELLNNYEVKGFQAMLGFTYIF